MDWCQQITRLLEYFENVINFYFRYLLEFILWKYKLEPLIWKKLCTSTFLVQERVLIWWMLSFFWPSRLSWWTLLAIEGRMLKRKLIHFECKEKICKFAQNKAVIVFWLSCKILFFTNRNHAFGAAEGLFQSFSPKYWMIFTHKTLILDSLSLGLEQNHSILELILKKPWV